MSPKKSNTKTKINLKRYLREYQALGTAGGLYHFRDEILRGNPQQFFVMHVDIACSFPLEEMLKAHMRHRGLCTMLSTKVVQNGFLVFLFFFLILHTFLNLRLPVNMPTNTVVLSPIKTIKSCTM